ncbi:hypothetical protein ATCC90586_010233 [Pythium insidiosum]|nr:hypothetical protein ATCC90586_010233 [Pythium insidiosum]
MENAMDHESHATLRLVADATLPHTPTAPLRRLRLSSADEPVPSGSSRRLLQSPSMRTPSDSPIASGQKAFIMPKPMNI